MRNKLAYLALYIVGATVLVMSLMFSSYLLSSVMRG